MACYSPFPLPRVFCTPSLASASSPFNLGPTHRDQSPLDANPLMVKVRSSCSVPRKSLSAAHNGVSQD